MTKGLINGIELDTAKFIERYFEHEDIDYVLRFYRYSENEVVTPN